MPYAAVYTPEPTRPSGGPRPGTLILQTWIINEWDEADAHDDVDPTNLGVYNPRDICGNLWPNWICPGSQHARGAAGDVGFPMDRRRWPSGHPEGTKLANWLVANHLALGIQEVIWAGRRWTNLTLAWRKYTGASLHYDHVHWAQTATAASRLTLAQIIAVAPKPPTPAPPAIQEDDMFFYEYDFVKDGKVTPILVQVTGAGQTRLSGQQVRDRVEQNPNYLGNIGRQTTTMFKLWKQQHGSILGAP